MLAVVAGWISGPRMMLLFAFFLASLGAFEATNTDFLARWHDTSEEATGLAPAPADMPDAIVQVYAAKTFGWRGIFGVHTWIAYKRNGASRYTVAEVARWNLARTGSAVLVSHRAPDAKWFGNMPDLLGELRGDPAENAIANIEKAVADYPDASRYVLWPGPNSNTFVAYVLGKTPQLRVDLPPTAIGKDYIGNNLVARAASGTGWRVGYGGLAGLTLALDEGVEVNLLGLVFGLDFSRPALKLPFVGRIGMSNMPTALTNADPAPRSLPPTESLAAPVSKPLS